MPRRGTLLFAGAFTLIEMLVVMAVISVLVAVSLSALARAQASGRSVRCISNLKQWGVALNLYANDNNGDYPERGQGVQPISQTQITVATDWFNCLPPYFGLPRLIDAVNAGNPPKPGDNSIFVCPDAKASTAGMYFLPYGMNMYLSPTIRTSGGVTVPHNRVQIPNPSQLAFLADGPVAWSSTVPSSQGYSVPARHSGRANVCFVDGHVVSFDGTYLGCGIGQPNPEHSDVRWHPDAGGIDQPAVP